MQQNDLEFELRLQQYIELLRTKPKPVEAQQHARKYLAPSWDTQHEAISQAAALLAFPPDTPVEPYKVGHLSILL